MNKLPIPKDEIGRITTLADFDLDYTNLENNFKDLTKLAASVAGTDISIVNLIDSFTQWSVSSHGLSFNQTPREDSVCQYTIASNDNFEVADLTADERFKDKSFLSAENERLKYYFGVPLKANGYNLGALCVLDSETRTLSPEKVELLQIIANEIVNRIKTLKVIQDLSSQVKEVSESQRRVAHDIRGPLGGIIGLARIISEQGNANDMNEVLEFVNLIHKSGNSILDLADEILTTNPTKAELNANQFNLLVLKEKLLKLYELQARNKQISFDIAITPESETVPFSKDKLLQIIGNLVSNSMKFTPVGGKIAINLTLKVASPYNVLHILVKDDGVGMDDEKIRQILHGGTSSTDGTSGEHGYGFGLALVKHLVESLKGTLSITSAPEAGTTFDITIPQR